LGTVTLNLCSVVLFALSFPKTAVPTAAVIQFSDWGSPTTPCAAELTAYLGQRSPTAAIIAASIAELENILIHNTDDHLRNHGFFQRRGLSENPGSISRA
jgi:hypothetical protein